METGAGGVRWTYNRRWRRPECGGNEGAGSLSSFLDADLEYHKRYCPYVCPPGPRVRSNGRPPGEGSPGTI